MKIVRSKTVSATSITLTLAQVIGAVGIGLLLLNSSLQVIDVLCRWLFSAPQIWVTEIYELTLPIAIAACFSLTVATRGMISIEAVGKLFGKRGNRAFTIWGAFFLLGLLIVMSWQVFGYSAGMVTSQRTSFYFGIPLAPSWFIVTLCFAFAALVQLSVLCRNAAKEDDAEEVDSVDML